MQNKKRVLFGYKTTKNNDTNKVILNLKAMQISTIFLIFCFYQNYFEFLNQSKDYFYSKFS